MADRDFPPDPTPPPALSRRETLRRAALLAIGAGLGVPKEAFASAPEHRSDLPSIYVKLAFHKGQIDGGQLVGTATLSPEVSAFLASSLGARASVKWYANESTTVIGTTTLSPEISANLQKLSTRTPGT